MALKLEFKSELLGIPIFHCDLKKGYKANFAQAVEDWHATYGGDVDDSGSVESDIIKNAAYRRDHSTGAMPGAGASRMGDVIRRLEERSLAQQRGLLWSGDAGSQDDIEEADAEDDSGGGEDDDGEEDDNSSFIDDADLVEMASRNQRLVRSNLIDGDWFVIAANKTLEHNVTAQPPPPPAPRAPSGPAMDKRLAKREKARRAFIQEHADEAVEWKANLSPATAAALKALETAASSRAECPFTANWSARSAGLTSAPEWPHDLEGPLSELDEAVCGAEETPLVGSAKRSHRPAGYTAVLLSHAVPFSEQEIKRNLKRLQAVRLVNACWAALQRALAPFASGAPVPAADQPAVALRAHLCLSNYRKALKKHRSALRQKERTLCSQEYAGLSDAQLQRQGAPHVALLGLALLPQDAQGAARRALAVSVTSIPDGTDTEDFMLNPRTTKFWEEGCVQHKALQAQLLALLRAKAPQAPAGSETELEALKANAVVLARANELDAGDAPPVAAAAAAAGAQSAKAAPSPAPAPPAAQAAAVSAAPTVAPPAPSSATSAPKSRAAPAGPVGPSTAPAAAAYGPCPVYGHFATRGAANSVLVIPDSHGQSFYVPSVPELTRALLDRAPSDEDAAGSSLSAAQQATLTDTQQDWQRTWANFKQPPPLSIEKLHDLVKSALPAAKSQGGSVSST